MDKPRILDDYPWFLVQLLIVIFYKPGFLDILCPLCMQFSTNFSFKVVS